MSNKFQQSTYDEFEKKSNPYANFSNGQRMPNFTTHYKVGHSYFYVLFRHMLRMLL